MATTIFISFLGFEAPVIERSPGNLSHDLDFLDWRHEIYDQSVNYTNVLFIVLHIIQLLVSAYIW